MTLNERCTQSYIAFAHAYRNLIKTELGIDELPKVTYEIEVFVEKGTDDQQVETLDIYKIYGISDQQICALKETQECAKLHLENGVIPAPELIDNEGSSIRKPSIEQVTDASLFNFLRWPLVHSIQTSGTLNFSDECMAEIYGTYFDQWTSEEIYLRSRFPIIGLSSEVAEIVFTDKLKITALSNESKSELYMRGTSGHAYPV